MMALERDVAMGDVAAYRRWRRPDPAVAATVREVLGTDRSLVNVGAGLGAYEPPDMSVVALDPSETMLALRPEDAAPAVKGRAEALPFASEAFDAAMAIASIHCWEEPLRGLTELKRVARSQVILFMWDRSFSNRSWVTRDYFPPPPTDETLSIEEVSEALGGEVDVLPVPVPHDVLDGMLHAYWRRPEEYLNSDKRRAIGWFRDRAADQLENELAHLELDLRNGSWHQRNRDLLGKDEFDCGYRLVTARYGPNRTKYKNRGARHGLAATVYTSPAELPPAWDECVQELQAPFFYTRKYLAAYHVAPPGDFLAARYLLVRADDNAAAVLPLFLVQPSDPRLVGNGTLLESTQGSALLCPSWHCYAGEFPLAESTGALEATWNCMREIARELGAAVHGFINLPADDWRLPALAAMGISVRPLDTRYAARITGATKHCDLSRVSSKHRREVRRQVRRAQEAGLAVKAVDGPDAALIGDLARMSGANAARLGSAQLYVPDRIEAFVSLLGERCTLVCVSHEDKMIGGAFCFTDTLRFHTWYGGMPTRKIGTFSPNYLLFMAELQEADRRELPIFEAGRRSGEFKQRYGFSPIKLSCALEVSS
jgi:hypothetical protein